jgi:thiopeptide-type bacteriocin biosynthesis protein
MSDNHRQRTAAPARFVLPSHDWLYYRLGVGAPVEGYHLIRLILAPTIRELCGHRPDLRWFYLRYLDHTGLHLRLRFHARLTELEHIESHLGTVLKAAYSENQPAWRVTGVGVGYRRLIYEPEHAKYGDESGIELAERFFQLGSEFAIRCVEQPEYWRHRLAYGLAHTNLVLATLPAGSRTSFLHQYEWYWTGMTRGKATRQQIALTGKRTTGPVLDTVAALAAGDRLDHLRRYAGSFWELMGSRLRSRVARTDQHLIFNHLHMMNNRLGLSPLEEALIANVLRTGHTATEEGAA